MDSSIFKSYDIRGIYPKDLNEKLAYEIGRAFVKFTKAKEVAVGRDMRLSSPTLFDSIVKGITDCGVNVFNIGKVATECIYFTVGKYNYDSAIMITASHNPKEYNGFKMIKKNNGNIEAIKGISLLKTIEENNFEKIEKKGKVKSIDIWDDYLKHIFSFIDINKIKPLKIVVDASNGMAGKVIPFLSKKLPVDIISLNFKLDGNFPAHSPNPLNKKSVNQISKTVKSYNADCGFIFDGDADRIFLIDELGNFVDSDVTFLILAKYFLEKRLKGKIVYNLIYSRAVPEFIKKWGGEPIKSKVGYINIWNKIRENGAIMGGEASGHFSFKNSFCTDSAFSAFLILLQSISESTRKVSEIRKEFSPYFKEPEINFKVKNRTLILEKIKSSFSDGEQSYLDGVTVEYDNWWFNVRLSQTEPLLRLTIEANNEKLLEKKKKELTKIIEDNR